MEIHRKRQLVALCLFTGSLSSWGQAVCIDDATSLLQIDARHTADSVHHSEEASASKSIDPNSGGKCLKFMHIPKTGGTSINSANMHRSSPVFESLGYEHYKRMSETNTSEFESKFHSDLGEMFDYVHHNFNSILPWILDHFNESVWRAHFISQPDGPKCEEEHTPPGTTERITDWYKGPDESDPCTVFCAVRNPFDRFISGYEMWHLGPCDPVGFENAVLDFLGRRLRDRPSSKACLFRPQVDFVYGANSKSSATKQYCDKIIHTEHLNEEFDAFMKEQGSDLVLPKKHMQPNEDTYKLGCKVNRDQITLAAKDLIYEYYRADFEAFGYEHP